jgi:DNA-directed RNA polymerase specialized sigma24 family protein
MRRILVERARRKRRARHGGDRARIDLGGIEPAGAGPVDDLLAVNEALEKLAAEDPLKADLVKLHCFAGLTLAEAAEAIGVSIATAGRYWAYARAWLRVEMAGYSPADRI